jgi:hypothetical protein
LEKNFSNPLLNGVKWVRKKIMMECLKPDLKTKKEYIEEQNVTVIHLLEIVEKIVDQPGNHLLNLLKIFEGLHFIPEHLPNSFFL